MRGIVMMCILYGLFKKIKLLLLLLLSFVIYLTNSACLFFFFHLSYRYTYIQIFILMKYLFKNYFIQFLEFVNTIFMT